MKTKLQFYSTPKSCLNNRNFIKTLLQEAREKTKLQGWHNKFWIKQPIILIKFAIPTPILYPKISKRTNVIKDHIFTGLHQIKHHLVSITPYAPKRDHDHRITITFGLHINFEIVTPINHISYRTIDRNVHIPPRCDFIYPK